MYNIYNGRVRRYDEKRLIWFRERRLDTVEEI